MSDLLEMDFCKSRSIRVNRQFNVSDGVESTQLAGATSLGCRFPISHRSSAPGGFILSRVDKQSGKDVSDLLASINEESEANPGPTAWLSASPDQFLPDTVTLPFPGNVPVVTPTLTSPNGLVQLSFQTIGFGGSIGFREIVVVPPLNLEYIAPATLALHNALWRYGAVSSTNPLESYRLRFVNASTATGIRPIYIWGSVPGQGGQVTQFIGNNTHSIGVSVVGTPVVLSGHQQPVLTPPVDFSVGLISATNGPEQTNRKFSYPEVGTLVNPDWNGDVNPNFSIGGTRPTLTVFAQGQFAADVGYDIFSVNGQPLTFQSTVLPFEQYQNPPFPGPTNFFNSETFIVSTNPFISETLYGQCNSAAQIEIPIGATSLTFQIHAAGSPTPTGNLTFDIPKAAGQAAWFEAVITASTHTV